MFQRPDGSSPSDDIIVAVPSRDTKPDENLSATVQAASFPLARAALNREGWALEPKPVMDLLAKIRRAGTTLSEYAGVKSLYGIKTGFNEAFLVDTPTRDRLVADDPGCAAILRPYLRGQDVERWSSAWSGLWMIFARRGIDIDQFPSVRAHLSRFRTGLEPKPSNWHPPNPQDEWPGRKGGNYAWYEIQDSVDYWEISPAKDNLSGDPILSELCIRRSRAG